MGRVLTALLLCSLFLLAARPASAFLPFPTQTGGWFATEPVADQAYAQALAAPAAQFSAADPLAPVIPAPPAALDGLGLNPTFVLQPQPEAELASWLASLDPDRSTFPDWPAVPDRSTVQSGEEPQMGLRNPMSEDPAEALGTFACVFWEPTLTLVSPEAPWLEDCEIIAGFALGLAKTWLSATAEPLVAQANFDPFPQTATNEPTGPARATLTFPAIFGAGTAEMACTATRDRIDWAKPLQAARVPSPFDPVTPSAASKRPSLAKAWPALRFGFNPSATITAATDLTNLPWSAQPAQTIQATRTHATLGPDLPLFGNVSPVSAKAWPFLTGFVPPAGNAPGVAPTGPDFRVALSPDDGKLSASLGPKAEAGALRLPNGISAERAFLQATPEPRPMAGHGLIGLLPGPLNRRVMLPAVPLWRSRDSPPFDPKLKPGSLAPRLAHDVRLGILDWCLGPSP